MRTSAWPILLLLVVGGAALAQVNKPKSTPYIPTKLDEYTAYCALWRTDATFRSTVRLKNSLDTAPIDATVTDCAARRVGVWPWDDYKRLGH